MPIMRLTSVSWKFLNASRLQGNLYKFRLNVDSEIQTQASSTQAISNPGPVGGLAAELRAKVK